MIINPSAKNKMLVAAIVFLVIANLATLATFWISRKKLPPGPPEKPSEFLVRELGFDEKQKEQYLKLVNEHQQRSEQIRNQVKGARDRLFNALKQQGITDSVRSGFLHAVSGYTEQLDLLTFDHFHQVRALCTPGQQKKFDSIIQNVLQMMAAPHPPGSGPQNRPPSYPPGDKDGNGPPPQ